VGLDISEPLLASARRRADELGVTTAHFVQGDAQTHELEQGAFDAIISRFGVMFFSDFDAAFANLRGALRPGGRMTFACWRSPHDNPLALVATKAAARFLPPLPEPDLEAPGRWAFADPERVRGILSRSGWQDIAIEPLDAPTPLSLDDAMRLNLRMGALGAALQQQDDAVREQVRAALAESLQPYVEDGLVRMTAACWLVTAAA
jgi:SAM-dependent methyltransferase